MARTQESQRSQSNRGGQRSGQSQGGEAALSEVAPLDDVVDYLRSYAKQKPEMAALWCFGVGFVLGWKLKPW